MGEVMIKDLRKRIYEYLKVILKTIISSIYEKIFSRSEISPQVETC